MTFLNIKIKRSIAIVVAFFVLAGLFPSFVYGAENEFRGIWVSTVFAIDYPSSGYTTDCEVLKSEAIDLLDNISEMGFNAVFLQVRPSCDAFYKSEIFPWSKYLTGTQGQSPDNDFDPLAFFVDEAHKRGLELHAWINPYRVTATSSDNDLLSANNPAVLYPELTVTYTDGKIYLNPGEPKARQLILDGIDEIITNYDVDGIHLDDYFYPGEDFDDTDAFQKYGQEFSSIGDWRRNNNDLLISGINDLIEDKNPDIEFGVSPGGIWANESSNLLGSETNGNQTYYDSYADTRKWVKEEYVDYILPQIYWNIGHAAADYKVLVNWWSEASESTNVELYIGQAAYKAGSDDISDPWYGVSEIREQVDLNRNTSNVNGYSMFSYNSFVNNQELKELIKELQNLEYTRGDVTQDGVVNCKDALHLLQYLVEIVELDSQGKATADFNDSGDISILDVEGILRFSVGQ